MNSPPHAWILKNIKQRWEIMDSDYGLLTDVDTKRAAIVIAIRLSALRENIKELHKDLEK